MRLKTELYLYRYLTGKHVPRNIERVLDRHQLLRRFRDTVMYRHICPICGREFSTQNAVIVHLLRDRRCSTILNSLVDAVLELHNYDMRARMLEKELGQLELHIQ